jgi:hypothetical protein
MTIVTHRKGFLRSTFYLFRILGFQGSILMTRTAAEQQRNEAENQEAGNQRF